MGFVQRCSQPVDDIRIMWCTALTINLQLINQLINPDLSAIDPDLADPGFSWRVDDRDTNVTPAFFVVRQHAISSHPRAAAVLGGVEDNPAVGGVNQREVPHVWKEVGLHHSQSHSGLAF